MTGPAVNHPRRTYRHAAIAATVVIGALATLTTTALAVTPIAPTFSHASVSSTLAGGEPFVSYDPSGGKAGPDLVYTSHEGTTHLFRNGVEDLNSVCVIGQPQPSGFVCSYANQVNVWTSTNPLAGPSSWIQTTVGHNLTGQNFNTGPAGSTSPFGAGFSDPDLSIDEGGYLYDTGINLANDSVFASNDGGRSFLVGNNNCHSGDRPWLAGGVSGEVFLATDTTVDPNTNFSSGHEIFHGVITGTAPLQTLTCSGAGGQNDPTGTGSTGITDVGTSHAAPGGQYSAAGKLFYDHNTFAGDPYHGAIIDPAIFANGAGANGTNAGGVGISILPNAAQAFTSGVASFPQQYQVPVNTGVFAHWPSIAIDTNDIVYLVWDTTDGTSAGLTNKIMLSTFDLKNPSKGFTTPLTIAHPGTTVLWPWVATSNDRAGAGNAAVVWYQYNNITNPDSGGGDVRVMESSVFGTGTVAQAPVDAVGTPIHSGGICQAGTTCVATGQDRRLGDFFTDAVDKNGCVLIATGETSITDPKAATSRPLYIQQTGGDSLLTGQTCATPTVGAVPEAPWAGLVLGAGGAAAAVLFARRRRRGVAA